MSLKFYAILPAGTVFPCSPEKNSLSLSLFDQKLIDPVADWMLKQQQTVAAAESVTSGLMQLALSSAPKAMRFYQGGITVYNLGQKSRHLSIDPIHALYTNCVSEKVAAEMALGVCKLFSSDWGIGITGFASPVPESENQVYAYYAISNRDKIVASKHLTPPKDEPFAIQLLYVTDLLKEFATQLARHQD
jgi:nicotinamide-nucleotide amidase